MLLRAEQKHLTQCKRLTIINRTLQISCCTLTVTLRTLTSITVQDIILSESALVRSH